MSKIKSDSLGLFVNTGGYKCRPVKPSRFVAGDNVPTKHFGGGTKVGVGKDMSCGRGDYHEYWITTGMSSDVITVEKEKGRIAWYKVFASHGLTCELSEEDKALAEEYHYTYVDTRGKK